MKHGFASVVALAVFVFSIAFGTTRYLIASYDYATPAPAHDTQAPSASPILDMTRSNAEGPALWPTNDPRFLPALGMALFCFFGVIAILVACVFIGFVLLVRLF